MRFEIELTASAAVHHIDFHGLGIPKPPDVFAEIVKGLLAVRVFGQIVEFVRVFIDVEQQRLSLLIDRDKLSAADRAGPIAALEAAVA